MKYHFKVHREKDGLLWAQCVELKGCQTQGKTDAELLENAREVLDLYLSEPETSKTIFPRPKRGLRGRGIIEVAPSPSVSFAMLLRELRLKNNMTMQEMKEALGIKHISAYQRLENPARANPELKTIARIKRRFPELRLEDVFS